MSAPLVDVYATYSHYRAHLKPIFDALPPEMRGTIHPLGFHQGDPDRVALVAGYCDGKVIGQRQKMFYVEHGAGQTYTDPNPAIAQNPSYSGMGGHRLMNVLGFIAPSQAVADRWQTAPAVAVGCPKLDQYRGIESSNPTSVCFTFHFPGTMVPENGSAWRHYMVKLPAIVASLQQQGLTVFGHSHPRWDGYLDAHLSDAGMTLLQLDYDVFRTAGMLIADNTSLLPEMASLGRSIMLLNAPWYRRDVEHGGRFWDWARYVPAADGPEDLLNPSWFGPTMRSACIHGGARIAAHTYAFNDDQASKRAASFIVERVLDEM